MADKLNVLQVGGTPLNLGDEITFNYVDLTEIETAEIDDNAIMVNNRINPVFNEYLFLIPADSSLVGDLSWLEIFPANAVILDHDITIPTNLQKLAQLLNVQYLSFADQDKLSKDLLAFFFKGQYGIYRKIEDFKLAPGSNWELEIFGEGTFIIHGTNSETLTYLGTYGKPTFILGSQQFEILVECDVVGDETEIEFQVDVRGANSDYHEIVILKNAAIHKLMQLPFFDEAVYVSVSAYARGDGDISLGAVSFRKARSGHGVAMIGGESHVTDNHMTQETIFFFDAGDLKPPLNVYFSGYRLAPGFEGYFMMKRMGAPFILINDPRMIGGQFYVGKDELENDIVNYIKDKLQELNFSEQDLILSGLSMGSFAALYYTASLRPETVIVGKPLINLGTIAQNTRLKRPYDFDISLDMMLSWVGGISELDIEAANNIFWRKFKTADLSETEFIIAYMKDDDYENLAFRQLNEFLRQKFPQIKIIHKGYIGRHNDNSGGIVNWFLSQYYRVLKTKFNR